MGERTTNKRLLVPKAKPGQLLARYGRASRGQDLEICYAWGGRGADSPDARILSNALEEVPVFGGRSLSEELTRRGYDITTLRFSIERLPTPSLTQGANPDA